MATPDKTMARALARDSMRRRGTLHDATKELPTAASHDFFAELGLELARLAAARHARASQDGAHHRVVLDAVVAGLDAEA